MQVCGCRDHRDGSQFFGQTDRQFIGSSHMPGQQRDHILPLFIHDQYRAVMQLVRDPGGNSPNRNTAGTDEHQRMMGSQLLTGPD